MALGCARSLDFCIFLLYYPVHVADWRSEFSNKNHGMCCRTMNAVMTGSQLGGRTMNMLCTARALETFPAVIPLWQRTPKVPGLWNFEPRPVGHCVPHPNLQLLIPRHFVDVNHSLHGSSWNPWSGRFQDFSSWNTKRGPTETADHSQQPTARYVRCGQCNTVSDAGTISSTGSGAMKLFIAPGQVLTFFKTWLPHCFWRIWVTSGPMLIYFVASKDVTHIYHTNVGGHVPFLSFEPSCITVEPKSPKLLMYPVLQYIYVHIPIKNRISSKSFPSGVFSAAGCRSTRPMSRPRLFSIAVSVAGGTKEYQTAQKRFKILKQKQIIQNEHAFTTSCKLKKISKSWKEVCWDFCGFVAQLVSHSAKGFTLLNQLTEGCEPKGAVRKGWPGHETLIFWIKNRIEKNIKKWHSLYRVNFNTAPNIWVFPKCDYDWSWYNFGFAWQFPFHSLGIPLCFVLLHGRWKVGSKHRLGKRKDGRNPVMFGLLIYHEGVNSPQCPKNTCSKG